MGEAGFARTMQRSFQPHAGNARSVALRQLLRRPAPARVAHVRAGLLALGLLAMGLLAAGPLRAAEDEPRPHIPALAGVQHDYWQELVGRAESKRLWDERFWHLLMHYLPDTLGSGFTSEADGPGFFLAPDGKTSPRGELDATLAAFFSTATIPPADMTPQCTFPARYRWLGEQLGFDPERLPRQDCPLYEQWRRRTEGDSVTLIFSSYFFNNPASMFGHTLLRFNRKGRTSEMALLDSALNFAAYVPPDTADLIYAWNGMLGGYRGYFSILPFHLKVREYSNQENRDLWEYELRFDASQVDYMLRHTWEMGSTYFDYFFFKENCSYHLLSILEVGRPELHLREAYHFWTLPTDTVEQLMAQPGLVETVRYRPSQGSRFAQKLDVMTNAERDWARRVIDGPDAADEPGFAALPQPRQALVLDAAIDYYQYKLAGKSKGEEAASARLRRLLLRRSRIRIPASELPALHNERRSSPPHEGHDSSRVELAGGASRPEVPGPDGHKQNQPFGEITVQASFHDLLSDDRAFAPDSQIELLHLRARYEREPAKWRLERFAIADVISLFPLTMVMRQPSWKAAFGWQRNRDIGCERCAPFFLNGGVGLTLQTHLLQREVYFLMVEGSAEFDDRFESQHRAGFGVSAGFLFNVSDTWRIGVFGTRTHYTAGQSGYLGQAALQQRIALTRNVELSLEWRGVADYREGKLGLGYYF
jgi:hypothetical protein